MDSLFKHFKELNLRMLKVQSDSERDGIVRLIVNSIDAELEETNEEDYCALLSQRLAEAKQIGDWQTRNAVIDHVVDRRKHIQLREMETQKKVEVDLLKKKYLFPHMGVLLRKRKELVWVEEDDYGSRNICDFAWNTEIEYFITTVVDPTDFKLLNENSLHKETCDFIESTYKEKNNDPVITNSEGTLLDDAIQFEKTCADIIKNQGWEVRLTKRTGDQGADIICAKDSISIVCQVKMFATKVGNKAVQEVLGAKEYYQSDLAVVIAKEGFTNSAVKLASCSSVILLRFSHLEKFTIKVFSIL